MTSTAASPREVVFVDSTLPNWQDLLTHISPDAKVVVLDPLKNGIVQMAEALQNETGVQAVHLLSHGGSGFVVVGNTMLSSYNLDSYAAQWATIRAALTDNADVLLYGCDVAQGEAGASFMQQLALATGADVAASSDDTGVSGDWVLEVQSGAVEAQGIEAADYTADLATIVVTTLNDAGAGSLRAAIASANNTVADTIVFDPALFASGAQTLTLTSGELDVHGNANNDHLTIVGPGENLLTISGNNASRIFAANTDYANNNQSPLTLSDMTITAGKNTTYYSGGALTFVYSGTLTLDHVRVTNSVTTKAANGGVYWTGANGDNFIVSNSTFSGNSSVPADGKSTTYAGGLGATAGAGTTAGSITVTNSTFSGNSSGGGGGAMLNVAGSGTTTVINSTFANNTSNLTQKGTGAGGGLLIMSSGAATIMNSTIVGNTANMTGPHDGGGLAILSGATVTLTNTLLANNTGMSGADQNLWIGNGASASGKNNLVLNTIGTYNGGSHTLTGTITTLGSALGSLSYNGGPVKTIALASGSSAIDAGTATGAPSTDGRGFTRGGTIDIGAYEFNDNNTFDFTSGLVSPAKGSTEVPGDYNLAIDFGRAVSAVAGKNIIIYKTSDNSVFETIPANDGRVTFGSGIGGSNSKVTINPTGTLAGSTQYYVQIDSGAFTDSNSDAFTGISTTTDWAFTTKAASNPTVTNITSTKANGTYGAGTVIDVTVTFSAPVTVTGTPQLTLETGTTMPSTTAAAPPPTP